MRTIKLNLLVHPIVGGQGMARLFPPDEPRVSPECKTRRRSRSGVLNLRYARAAA